MKENNIYINNDKNFKENSEDNANIEDKKLVYEINGNKDIENFDGIIKKMKFFSYGVVSSALVIFFISGGINSFLFTVIFFLILNNNLLILEEKNIYIYYAFINFC